jgi:hypothetical protein
MAAKKNTLRFQPNLDTLEGRCAPAALVLSHVHVAAREVHHVRHTHGPKIHIHVRKEIVTPLSPPTVTPSTPTVSPAPLPPQGPPMYTPGPCVQNWVPVNIHVEPVLREIPDFCHMPRQPLPQIDPTVWQLREMNHCFFETPEVAIPLSGQIDN